MGAFMLTCGAQAHTCVSVGDISLEQTYKQSRFLPTQLERFAAKVASDSAMRAVQSRKLCRDLTVTILCTAGCRSGHEDLHRLGQRIRVLYPQRRRQCHC